MDATTTTPEAAESTLTRTPRGDAVVIADAGHDAGVLSVVVTGAYIHKEPLVELCAKVDAIKVDLKSYSEDYDNSEDVLN